MSPEDVAARSGLTPLQLEYLTAQEGIHGPRHNEWPEIGAAQAVLFGLLSDCVDNRAAFNGCRAIGIAARKGDLAALRGMFLVVTGHTAHTTHDPEDFPPSVSRTVVALDDVLARIGAQCVNDSSPSWYPP